MTAAPSELCYLQGLREGGRKGEGGGGGAASSCPMVHLFTRLDGTSRASRTTLVLKDIELKKKKKSA